MSSIQVRYYEKVGEDEGRCCMDEPSMMSMDLDGWMDG